MRPAYIALAALAALALLTATARADRQVKVLDTPAYNWFYGCFGTAGGNLVGYWDRNGLPNLYTGMVNGGIAPTNTLGTNLHIWTMWATRAGYAGRASNAWGHVDDYYHTYEGTNDPYRMLGRAPHEDDCLGDFMGLSHWNWTNLNGECNGNIDAYAVNYFDTNGTRRYNYDAPTPDVQSGVKRYFRYCGYDAEVFSQVCSIYTKTPAHRGFSFFDFMQYIDAGCPILMFLQPGYYARTGGANPPIHGILGYGYRESTQQVYVRDSWGNTPDKIIPWSSIYSVGLPSDFQTRGLIVTIPKPRLTGVSPQGDALQVNWEGGHSLVTNFLTFATETTHWYVVEGGAVGDPEAMVPLTPATTARSATITGAVDTASLAVRGLFRVRFQDDVLGTSVVAQVTNKFGPTNLVFDIDLEQVRSVSSPSNLHWNLRGLEFTKHATNYDLRGNVITNLEILVRTAERGGMGTGVVVDVRNNPLNDYAKTNQIPALTNLGTTVFFTP